MADFNPEQNLMINYVPRSLTEQEFRKIFEQIGEIASCRLMIKKDTGESMGYGFVSYVNSMHSELAIDRLHGLHLQGKQLKVGYAKRSSDEKGSKDANVYIAGLPASLKDKDLLEMFSPFGEILTHKIIEKGGNGPQIAFVRYAKLNEAEHAISEMAEKELPGATKPLTVKLAIPGTKNKANVDNMNIRPLFDKGNSKTINRFNPMAGQSPNMTAITSQQMHQMKRSSSTISPGILVALASAGITAVPSSGHANIVTGEVYSLYIYGLPPDATETTLYELFCPFGGILNVRPIRDMQKEGKPCKGFGFVNFRKYVDACHAMVAMDGFAYEGKVLKVSFKESKGAAVPDDTSHAFGQNSVTSQKPISLQQYGF